MHLQTYDSQLQKPPAWTRVVLIGAGMLVFMLLGIVYENVVVTKYNFGGFELRPKDSCLLELALISMWLLMLPQKISNPTALFGWLTFVFLVIPASVLSFKKSEDVAALLLIMSGSAAAIVISHLFRRALWRKVDHDISASTAIRVKVIIPLFIVFVSVTSLWINNGAPKFLSFSDVYEERFSFNQNIPFILKYLIKLGTAAVPTLLFVVFLSAKRYLACFGMLSCSLVFYGLTTHKSVLFAPLFGAAFYLISLRKCGGLVLLTCVLLLSTLALLSIDGGSWRYFGSLFANRVVFLPAHITYTYISEFSAVGPQLWAESSLSLGFIASDLDMPAVNYISTVLGLNQIIVANTGWIGSGYMNAGIVGVLLYALLFGFFLSVVDRWAVKFSGPVLVGVFAKPIHMLINSADLLVGLLTGGIFALLVLVYLTFSTAYTSAPSQRG